MWLKVKELKDGLIASKVKYVHWKSNYELHKAVCGHDDLDLLIHRDDRAKFMDLLLRQDYKEARNNAQSIIGVRHFYGLDIEQMEILHLHTYTQIYSGPSWSKSYHFRAEDNYLTDFIFDEKTGLRVPQKHFEQELYLCRLALKFTSPLESLLVIKSRKSINKELVYLGDSIGSELKKTSNLHIDLERFRNALVDNKPLYNILICSLRIRLALSNFKVKSLSNQVWISFYSLAYRVINKVFLGQKKYLVEGGVIISITGLDASGKTTMLKGLNKFLSKHFTVQHFHFGKPPSTVFSLPFDILISCYKAFRGQGNRISSQDLRHSQSWFYVFAKYNLAHKRHSLIQKAERLKRKGVIVTLDRFKTEGFGLMDGPALSIHGNNRLKRFIARKEHALYNLMSVPDLILHLEVPLQEAISRNNARIKADKETEEALIERYRVNKNAVFKAHSYLRIRTDKESQKNVQKRIIQEVWRII